MSNTPETDATTTQLWTAFANFKYRELIRHAHEEQAHKTRKRIRQLGRLPRSNNNTTEHRQGAHEGGSNE